jgi:hypothetical protein
MSNSIKQLLNFLKRTAVNIKFGYTRWETDQENSPDARLLFFLFQKLVQIIFYIC